MREFTEVNITPLKPDRQGAASTSTDIYSENLSPRNILQQCRSSTAGYNSEFSHPAEFVHRKSEN
jgi:hypothetical protein